MTDFDALAQPDVHLIQAVLEQRKRLAVRSLADVGEEVTLTQYRSLVVLALRLRYGS